MNYGRRFVTLYRRQGSRLSPWGIGMGNTCKPMAVSFQCMTKFTTSKKKKDYPHGREMQKGKMVV